MRIPQHNSGFTLIELLVVIAIITMLTSVLVPLFSKAQHDTRDSARIATIKQLKTAMDLYWTSHYRYPIPDDGPCIDLIGWSKLDEVMTGDFKDPIFPANANFRYCTPNNTADPLYGRSYGILVLLEDEDRKQAEPSDNSGDTNEDGYCKTGVNVSDFPGDWAGIPMCNF